MSVVGVADTSHPEEARRRLPGATVLALCSVLALALTSCTHRLLLPPPDGVHRPEAPPPARLRPRFRAWGLTREPLPQRSTSTSHAERFSFTRYCDVLGRYIEVTGEITVPEGPGPFPLIAVSPILGGAEGGYLECTIFGDRAARDGLASFYLYQDQRLLRPADSATILEGRLRSWVRSMILALDVLAESYPIDSDRLGAFGISLGGIRGAILAAAEPRLRANVICLAGAPIAEVLRESRETLVRRYLRRRSEITGMPEEWIARDFELHLYSDPARVAGAVDPARVLFFLARFDDKVPASTGWNLHARLGAPELRVAPLGHYTSILVLPWAAVHSTQFFARRFADGVVVPPAGGPQVTGGASRSRYPGLRR